MEKINKSLLKLANKKNLEISISNQSNSAKLFWKRFISKKVNIFALSFFLIIVFLLIFALFFIKYSATTPIYNSKFINNLPSQFSPIVKQHFERGADLEFIRKVAELEKNRAAANGTTPIFKILYDSAFDSGGDLTTKTDIVILYYNPYDLIKAINLNNISSNKINLKHFSILGTNNDGIDIFSRIFTSIIITFLILLGTIFINIIIGFSFGAFVALKNDKWYAKILDSIATIINSIPELLWIFLLCIFMGTNNWAIALSFILISWTSFYELAKNETLELRKQEFILAAKAIGLNQTQIIYRHLFIKIFPMLLILITDKLAINILIVSSLAFLDFLISSNSLNIGVIFKEAISMISTNVSYILVLTIAITLFSVSLKLFSNAISTTYNPKIVK
ncbi:ABC transporter permease [Metamycoplasma buccale]|uniref:ABC transporter permease n=1 Tax=Metamycoplasma buccale TaxID=55602 RepID=UPI00398F793A